MRNNLLFSVLIVFLSLAGQPLFAQSKSWAAEAHYHRGIVLPVDKFTPHLTTGNPQMVTLRWMKQTQGRKAYDQVWNFPKIGFALGGIDFDNPQLGHALTLMACSDFSLWRTRFSTLHFGIGLGVGFVTNPFDRQTNAKNIMLGSVVNSAWSLGLTYEVCFAQAWRLFAGVSITHLSNGALKLPNLGVNMAMAQIGVGYRPAQALQKVAKDSLLPRKHGWQFHTFWVGGALEQYPTNGPKYFVSTLQVAWGKRFGRVFAWQLGLEWNYNSIWLSFNKDNEQLRFNPNRWAISGGLEAIAGRLSFLFQWGYYIFKPQPLDNIFFQRYALRYVFKRPAWWAMWSMKSQLGSVDNFEFGLGYTWGIKKPSSGRTLEGRNKR
ncbi:MAG TPA: hypothetical protein DCM08_13825 [Microscillaceae bacterium]|jgi:hypothetical protein|nr:hypothetical protein [Microscillaceae bacterium]